MSWSIFSKVSQAGPIVQMIFVLVQCIKKILFYPILQQALIKKNARSAKEFKIQVAAAGRKRD
jgi:hypothetical protein